MSYNIKFRPKIPRNKYGYLASSSTGGAKTIVSSSSSGGEGGGGSSESWDYTYPETIKSQSNNLSLGQNYLHIRDSTSESFLEKNKLSVQDLTNDNIIEIEATDSSTTIRLDCSDQSSAAELNSNQIKFEENDNSSYVSPNGLVFQTDDVSGGCNVNGLKIYPFPNTEGTDIINLVGACTNNGQSGKLKAINNNGSIKYSQGEKKLTVGSSTNKIDLEVNGDLGINGDLKSDNGFSFDETTDVIFKKKPLYQVGTTNYTILDKSDVSTKIVDGLNNETSTTPAKQKLYPVDNNQNVIPSNKVVYDYVEGKIDHWGMNSRTNYLECNDDDVHIPTTRWVLNMLNGGVSPTASTSKDLTDLIKLIDFSTASTAVVTCNYSVNVGVSDWRELIKYRLYGFINDNDNQPVEIKLVADTYDDEIMNIVFQHQSRTSSTQTYSNYLCTFMGRVKLENNTLTMTSYIKRANGATVTNYSTLV